MKVFLRDEDTASGACIGDVPPTEIMGVYRTVREASVYHGSDYYSEFTHQIYFDGNEAVFEIVCHH